MGSMENEVERGESCLGIFAGLRAPLAFMAKIWTPDCVGTCGEGFSVLGKLTVSEVYRKRIAQRVKRKF